ncbi:MAG TPA: thioredoxin domain-containing protein [Acidobacteriaceae bacterium]|nr:thioredoxin domain-containing protein [Acidobacteriaceae bacterium]
MRISRFLLAFILIAGVGCRAQTPPAGNALQAKLDRQIELTIRSQFNVPPDYTVTLGDRSKSDINGFDTLPVIFSNGSQKKTTLFLISKDNNTLARLEKFDLTKAPGSAINVLGRPIRGNPKAKVTIVNFDDLECPFCARMNEVLFPGTEQHYGNLVRYIYLDFPLVQLHPWAMHAAVDVNCLAGQSAPGYWNLVDTLHEQSDEISGSRGQQNLAASVKKVDDLALAEGKRDNVDMGKLQACISKQDNSAIRASMGQGEALGVDGTPTLFINGERATGALSQSMLWTIIDRAIRDAGEVPPPDNNSTPATTATTPTAPGR